MVYHDIFSKIGGVLQENRATLPQNVAPTFSALQGGYRTSSCLLEGSEGPNATNKGNSLLLRGAVAILFISHDACSDSIAKTFHACFYGVLHYYRAVCCKMGYRTDVLVRN